ncbi:MAG: tRNA 2-thiouridine(34) synthase MnmA [Actinomycetaceae bacterium]|nr:tRNA 2-thiouridine(34) synthase MnmA [Arcanobacterium sp.]MDD7505297.1 tRNA 2-thiouridine(34) synthase MnmA [Actinomycetaceae bacterium]MDY6143523.1 tRNA 2-thiouridine(34) synthase MnmA [Arcanobacterium sp.]
MKILAAMSGGVDSSVATARAVEAGHSVTGVYLALHENLASTEVNTGPIRGCGNPQDRADAEQIASQLGIDFEVWDYAEEFSRIVINEFLSRYAAGHTPNPCVFCNENVKFAVLQRWAMENGYDAVATGHYARVLHNLDNGNRVELHRANYRQKDQSYVLSAVGNEVLEHSLFPLGDMESKDAVRAEAAKRGLFVSQKPDSYDICFIPDGDTLGFLRARLGSEPGPIVDPEGVQIGEHQGAIGYTVGQRKGLGIGRPAKDGKPRYVLDVNPATNTVVVGPRELLGLNHIVGEQPVWLADELPVAEGVRAGVQVRAHGREIPATVRIEEDAMYVDLDEEVRGLPRGQSVVVYLGSRVMGQSVVAHTSR